MNMIEPLSPNITFEKFVQAHGYDKIRLAYRRPLVHKPGDERHWDFYEGPDLVGWGSIMRVDGGVTYSYRAGVFPVHERRGYRQRIRRMLAIQAFGDPACIVFVTSALLSNPTQVVRLVQEAARGEWAAVAGAALDPPRLIFAMTREFFETRVQCPADRG